MEPVSFPELGGDEGISIEYLSVGGAVPAGAPLAVARALGLPVSELPPIGIFVPTWWQIFSLLRVRMFADLNLLKSSLRRLWRFIRSILSR